MRTIDRSLIRDPILTALMAAIGTHISLGCSDSGEASNVAATASAGGTGGAPGGHGGAAGGGRSGGGGGVTVSSGGTGATPAGSGGHPASVRDGGGGTAPVRDAAPPTRIRPCNNPRPYLSADTGWIACDGGFLHRAETGTCAIHPLADAGVHTLYGGCTSDSECSDLVRGRCWADEGLGGTSAPCLTDCVTDLDCPAQQVCVCGTEINRCMPSNCKTDDDCGPGLLCATYSSTGCGGGIIGAACQTPTDECTTELDCLTPAGRPWMNQQCTGFDGARICEDGYGGCGRPFLVEGRARTAEAVVRSEWTERGVAAPDLASLTPTERTALTEHFTRMGLLEHASVAAFARFMLELLAVGAPADLVADAARAVEDERRHAVTCFTLASAYAGAPVGPGPLALDDCRPATDLHSLVEATFLEGCIGETTAALEARELAALVEDPGLRAVLSGIAEDETRHAVLAWRTVSWAFARDPARIAPLLRRLERTLHAELSSALQAPESFTMEGAGRLGVPSATFSLGLRRRALTEIVLPCLRALMEYAPVATPTVSINSRART